MPTREQMQLLARRLLWLLLTAALLTWGLQAWQARLARRAVADFTRVIGTETLKSSLWMPGPYEALILRRIRQDPRPKRVIAVETLGSAAWVTFCVGEELGYTVELDGRRNEARIADITRVDGAMCRLPAAIEML